MVFVSGQWCQRSGYWTSHTFLPVFRVQQSLWCRLQRFLQKVAFSVFQHVWQLNRWLTRACRRCARTRPRPYTHKGSIVGRQTVSCPLANLCGSDSECDTETAVCHTYTHADRQTRRDVVAQSRAVIIQHLTESDWKCGNILAPPLMGTQRDFGHAIRMAHIFCISAGQNAGEVVQ